MWHIQKGEQTLNAWVNTRAGVQNQAEWWGIQSQCSGNQSNQANNPRESSKEAETPKEARREARGHSAEKLTRKMAENRGVLHNKIYYYRWKCRVNSGLYIGEWQDQDNQDMSLWKFEILSWYQRVWVWNWWSESNAKLFVLISLNNVFIFTALIPLRLQLKY